MNNRKILAFEITFVLVIFLLVFGPILLFIFSDSNSIREFFSGLLFQTRFKSSLFYGLLVLKTIFILSGMYFISYFFVSKYFIDIEKYNKKLKDYNHYLAHELKTPIAVINSNLEVLKYGYSKEKVENSQDELKKITKIINGLLTFSESLNSLDKKEINVENFIKSYISFKSYKENISIINNEFNFSIETDDVLFERVVKNLIENAIKYSVDKKIIIHIKHNKLVFENNLYKTMDEDGISKIFNKFYSSTYNDNTGTGLGLAMIKEIVKVLGFKLNLKSQDNKFFVEIIY